MQFTLNKEQLLKPLQQVCGILDNRPPLAILSHVLLQLENDVLSMTGTDLEVELTAEAPVTYAHQDGQCTLPGKKLLDICRSLPNDAEIMIKITDNRALITSGRSKFNLTTLPASDYPNLTNWEPTIEFKLPQTTLRRLIDGNFPDYRRVMPINPSHIIEADWEKLKQAFVRVAILSNERFRRVRLNISENLLKITAQNPEQEEAEEIIDISYQGADLEVGFNVKYILDVLDVLKCQRVRFRLADANSSCLIEDCDDSSAEYIIMPMRL